MHAALRHTRAPVVRRMASELGFKPVVRRMMTTEGLGFKDFIRMSQVKAQYREMLRLARRYAKARPAAGADSPLLYNQRTKSSRGSSLRNAGVWLRRTPAAVWCGTAIGSVTLS